MHVCLITSAPIPPREGVGYHVWNLAHQLTAHGHRVSIVTRGGARRSETRQIGAATVWWAPFAPVYPLHVYLHGLFVNRLLRQIGGDFDVINEHTPLPPAIASPLPLVTTVHTPMLADTAATVGWSPHTMAVRLQTPISRQIELDLLRRSQKITAVAGWVAQALRAYGVEPDSVGITGNGVEACFLHEPTTPRTAPIILCVGRVAPGKGLEDLVRASKIVASREPNPDLRFVIAGDGSMLPRLRRLVAEAGLESRFDFRGHISVERRDELVSLYRQAMIFVLPSHHEGLPTVLLEAMAAGVPVVSTSVGGAQEVATHGRDALLVPPHNSPALAEAILSLLGSPELRRSLGAQAYKTVRAGFTWDVVAQRYLTCYEQAIDCSGSAHAHRHRHRRP